MDWSGIKIKSTLKFIYSKMIESDKIEAKNNIFLF